MSDDDNLGKRTDFHSRSVDAAGVACHAVEEGRLPAEALATASAEPDLRTSSRAGLS